MVFFYSVWFQWSLILLCSKRNIFLFVRNKMAKEIQIILTHVEYCLDYDRKTVLPVDGDHVVGGTRKHGKETTKTH